MNSSSPRRVGAALVCAFAISAFAIAASPADAGEESKKNEAAAASENGPPKKSATDSAAPRAATGSAAPAAANASTGGASTQAPSAATKAEPVRPRHGARAKAADGTLVLFDNVFGLYMVPGHQDTYWIGDRFYQYEHGVWLSAQKVAGPWELVASNLVPDEAAQKYATLKKPVTAKLPWGAEAVYDPNLKSYKVAGHKGVFLFDGMFYRYDNGVWLGAKREDGPWLPVSIKLLPVTLKKGVPAPASGQTVTLPDKTVVVYDSDAKLFRLQGKPDTVLFDGRFFEKRGDSWFSSPTAGGTFEEAAAASVPVPVRALFKKPAGSSPKDAAKKNDGSVKKASGKQKDAKGANARKNAANKRDASSKKQNQKKGDAKKHAADASASESDEERE